MPLYLGGRPSISTTDPTGSSSGSAAATPVWTATPDVVVMPLQYAVALNASRAPGEGGAVASRSVGLPGCVLRVEDRRFVERDEADRGDRRHGRFRQNEPEMIMQPTEIVGSSAGIRPNFSACRSDDEIRQTVAGLRSDLLVAVCG